MLKRALATGLMVLSVVGCGSTSDSTSPDILRVSVSLYPIAEIVQRVGGDSVDVVNLTPPGTDAHDVELTAKQVQRLEESKVVFYFGDNFQPGVEKAINALNDVSRIDLFTSVELLSASTGSFGIEGTEDDHEDGHGHSDEEHDPHVWLDPANMIAMTNAVAKKLAQLQPANASDFAANSSAYISELTELGKLLDKEIGLLPDGISNRCDDVNFYTAHQGFTYLAERAGLNLVPIAGINPDEQVSAQYLESLSSILKGKNVTIFNESLISSSAAEALASSLNAKTDVLNPVEGLTEEEISNGVTYLSAQRDNIKKISEGLRCS